MSVVGIVAEYNPFHNGHAFHIAKAKELTGADAVVVVMSGDFVQRGEPAIVDKYTRARMALAEGADLVLELPVIYATASAETFAAGAVLLLEKTGIADFICFGSETGEIQEFTSLADTLLTEPEPYQSALKANLERGYSFPKARSLALGNPALLQSPNAVLGLEYCKAIRRYHCRIRPAVIARQYARHDDPRLSGGISSASAIRETMRERIPEEAIPASCADLLRSRYPGQASASPSCPIYLEDCRDILYYQILGHRHELSGYRDISPAIASRMDQAFSETQTIQEYAALIKNKSLTSARINRCFMQLFLGIRKEEFAEAGTESAVCYGRLLGFRERSGDLLRRVQSEGSLSVITKVADGSRILSERRAPRVAHAMWQKDIHASRIYQLLVSSKFQTALPDEYRRAPEHIL